MRQRLSPHLLSALIAMVATPSPGLADEVIHYQDWVRVRTAVGVLQLPALQRVVNEFEAGENSRIAIRYPGGDEGNAWAIELRDWLVSLGISSGDIVLQPGSGVPRAIVITTLTNGLP